ncbi:MAG: hypothetical protein E7519_03490, partial [Ruminococcaceae bacterium]|nr:hypothetical protein [Oscillospiraceae bacterium]
MAKVRIFERALSLLLVLSFAFTIVQADIPGFNASAASTATNSNLLKHSTFEETDVDLSQDNHIGNWFAYNHTQKVNHDAHNDSWAVEENATGDSLEQDVPNLKVGATYVLSVWAKVTDSGVTTYLGIKNYGGDEKKVTITSTDYDLYSIEFTYTGAADARAYVWSADIPDGEKVYVDDFSMTLKSDLQEVSIDNGTISATFKDSAAENMKKDNFNITYKSSIDEAGVQPLTIKNEEVDGNVLKMSFTPISAAAVDQKISVDLAYKPNEANEVWSVDFNIASDGSQQVLASLSGITAVNGKVTAVLDRNPT